MAKQTSSRPTPAAGKRKPSEAPAPVTKVIAKPEKQAIAQPAAATPKAVSRPSHDQIAQRAYELYQTRPHHEGNAENDWLRAENDLRA